jgi:hypothetical protein
VTANVAKYQDTHKIIPANDKKKVVVRGGAMTIYLMAYDLLNESGTHDYEPLWQELKAIEAQSVQDGLWMLEISRSLPETVQYFRPLLDSGDRLFITQLRDAEFFQSSSRRGTEDWLELRQPQLLTG